MIELIPCPGCDRHVRVDEAQCPFCEGTVPAAPSRSRRAGRLARAAIFVAGTALAAGAGCGDDSGDDSTMTDAGVQPDAPVATPYGAPPVRDRLV